MVLAVEPREGRVLGWLDGTIVGPDDGFTEREGLEDGMAVGIWDGVIVDSML